ncbi:GAL4-like Zn(II)2Cys6 (or C6 zinc) binuclear cluster DNA-binding domain [Rhizoctonia solani]|uniref:GAL4-like Zn(II)2Cys6 (Or C6 zinc) binuclear cluster DNA-binding domain n=1 Tax=Rhizoctonia solani TaxID=456999 RepID=A0A8H7IGF0_9AGAM|nr:GAL4-like Zn(II)2Cys6 (or C6 zinc) binuclear cluster DNA-binding domain [Rhizoctonia solani]
MSVASVPAMSSSEDPRSLPPFSNFIALSSRPPLHPHSNSFSDPRLSLAPVPSSPDRDQKSNARPSTSGPTRTSPPGLDRTNSTGKGSTARTDESGPANDDSDRPKRKRQSQSKLKYYFLTLRSPSGPVFQLHPTIGLRPNSSHMPKIHVASGYTTIGLNFSFDFINYAHLFFPVFVSYFPLASSTVHNYGFTRGSPSATQSDSPSSLYPSPTPLISKLFYMAASTHSSTGSGAEMSQRPADGVPPLSVSYLFLHFSLHPFCCDACRARKVRCARENPEDQTSSCKHCQALDIPCTYDYQPKKRGPPNLYLRRLQEAAAANLAAQQAAAAAGNVAQTSNANPPQTPAHSAGGIPATDGISPAPLSSVPAHGQHGRAPMSVRPSSIMEYNAALSSTSSLPVNLPPSRYPIAADQFQPPSYGHGGQSPGATSDGGSEGRPQTADAASQAHLEASFSSNHPLYNWSMPYKPNGYGNSHPSGMSLLPPLSYFYRPHRLDDVAPRERIMHIIGVFFDLVYPLTPCIHKPSFMADLANRREERDPLFFALVMPSVRRLAQQCHEASRHITVASYDPPTSMMVVIRYFDTCYHFCEGHDATSHAAFGEAAHIAVTLHMHEEASYEGLDPIECEIRRRPFATARLEEVRSLHTRISSALMHAPPALRLKPNPGRHGSKGLGYSSMAGQQDEYGGAGFRKAAFAEVKDFFDNPNASRANATNPYLVMQANLYVTQQLVRYVIEQYRDELVTSMRQNPTDNFDADLLRNSEDREQIAIDLLNVLHSIPIQSIATNGPSLVHKVRFVASTLLDAVRKAETAPASAARAHAYLWDFLSILSEIERNYLLDDDQDGGLGDHASAINV